MEFLAFAVLVALIGVMLKHIRAIELNLESIAFKSTAVLNTAEFEALLELEIQRARRLSYPLSLVMLQVRGQDGTGHFSQGELRELLGIASRGVSWQLTPLAANLFRELPGTVVKLRSTDSAIFDRQKNRFALTLVGTPREQAAEVARRVAAGLERSLGVSISYSCAEFPADHYLGEDLIERTEWEQTQYAAQAKEPAVAKKSNARVVAHTRS